MAPKNGPLLKNNRIQIQGPKNGSKFGSKNWTPKSRIWTQNRSPKMDPNNGFQKRIQNGPKKRTPKLDPKNGPQKWTPEIDPNNGPTNETQKWIPKLDPKNWTLDHRSGLSFGCQDRLHTSAVEKAYT
jgi:hypothetical protein